MKFKVRYLLFVMLLVLCVGIYSYNFHNNSLNKETKIIENQTKEKENISGYNSLAIMLQNEDGSYDLSDTDTWPTEGYVFNDVLSSCENGGKLSWNDGRITLKTSGSDKCYVYFDIMPIIQQNLQMLLNAAKTMNKDNQGELIKHDGTMVGLDYSNNASLSIADNFKDTYKSIDDLIKFYEDGDFYYLTYKYSLEEIDAGENDVDYYTISDAVKVAAEEGYITIKESVIDANDNGYRYSGNNPNNFICFGKGSESYNNSITDECPLANQYRIIGIVPVIKSDGKPDILVKVIKSEYATSEDLSGLTSKSLTLNSSYEKLARVQIKDGLVGFQWNSTDNVTTWLNSPLKETLNENYLAILGTTWKEKIELVKWNVKGIDSRGDTANVIKKKEESLSPKSTDKIGLMYAYDYGYASEPNSWKENLYNYNNGDWSETKNKNRENNWLFNGVTENIITNYIDSTGWTFSVEFDGSVNSISSKGFYGVRPVFYLKSDVKIINDGNTDGSVNKPYKIEI